MVRFVTTIIAALAATLGTANAQSDLVKRGGYLVNTIMTCANCHSPKGPPPAVAGKDYSGGGFLRQTPTVSICIRLSFSGDTRLER